MFSEDSAQNDITVWLLARVRVHDQAPSILFDELVTWMRQQQILLPSIMSLARLVIRLRHEVHYELWQALDQQLTLEQKKQLQALVVGKRYAQTEFDRLRHGPVVISAIALKQTLERIRSLQQFDLGKLNVATFGLEEVYKIDMVQNEN